MEYQGLIGIDLGTSSVKVVIVDRTDGRLLGAASAGYPFGASVRFPDDPTP